MTGGKLSPRLYPLLPCPHPNIHIWRGSSDRTDNDRNPETGEWCWISLDNVCIESQFDIIVASFQFILSQLEFPTINIVRASYAIFCCWNILEMVNCCKSNIILLQCQYNSKLVRYCVRIVPKCIIIIMCSSLLHIYVINTPWSIQLHSAHDWTQFRIKGMYQKFFACFRGLNDVKNEI